ncbi:MAG: fructosamine kinase family protein [Lachnospiraceae bacterium]|nr:fructosamine kinase family protein [Lachnospiraceae bacterium]
MEDQLIDSLRDLFGSSVTITAKCPVSGGDINNAFALTLSDGRKVFLKENANASEDFFAAEAKGLEALGASGVLAVPRVLAKGSRKDSLFLLLSYIREGARKKDFFYDFGRRLALLHKADTAAFTGGSRFGFSSDNYIGASRQINTLTDSWTDFFRQYRLKPQVESAWGYFDSSAKKKIGSLLERLDKRLEEPQYPSLLHGDLWSGNYMVTEDGEPALIDPAVYVGNREADLAMTQLFGGYPDAFYAGYADEAGIPYGYNERCELYNLYHMLNHLNLFGRAYLHGVQSIINKFA